MSHFFTSAGQSIGVSASVSVLPMDILDWFPLGWTGWISLQSKGLSRVFSNTTVQKHQIFSAQLSSQSNSHIHTWLLEKPSKSQLHLLLTKLWGRFHVFILQMKKTKAQNPVHSNAKFHAFYWIILPIFCCISYKISHPYFIIWLYTYPITLTQPKCISSFKYLIERLISM